MKKETALKIAALHDGQISGRQKTELEALIEQDPEAKAYLDELRRISDSLKGAHLKETENSAHWQNFNKRLSQKQQVQREKVIRFPGYATAAAAILVLGMGIWWPMRKMGDQSDLQGLNASVFMVETELENATPIVYIDEPSGWTVVWVVEQDPLPEQG